MMSYTSAGFQTSYGRKKIRIRLTQKDEKKIATGLIGSVQPQEPQPKSDVNAVEETAAKSVGKTIDLPHVESFQLKNVIDTEELEAINIKYPLIPKQPKQGERVFAYAHIYFDRTTNEPVYNVVEPKISDTESKYLEDIKEFIQDKLDINFAQIRKSDAVSYINDIFAKAVRYFKIKGDTDVLRYYVVRDFIGLEMIEPLMQDSNIEDISCDGVNIPIYVYHRDPRLGSMRTNISYSTKEYLDSFVNKLSERCGKTISVAKPLLDGALPDGSRVQATLGSDIARHGSNFTIRMFTDVPLTPVDMIKLGTCDLKTLSYLWFLIEHQASVLISGGTASGKTSLLNALSLFIKPQMKIVSIEDTAELRLPHSHWVPEVARTPIAEEGKVDMFELLRESLRQRPDYIIVGEVRGKEAYVLFQQIATGHAGMSTIHADTMLKLIDRLTTPPISLPGNLIQNIDVIIFIKRVKRDRRYSRRIASVVEVLGFDQARNSTIDLELIRWDPVKDVFNTVDGSRILQKIADSAGIPEQDVKKEITNRAKILKWMCEKGINDYKKISSIISLYYLSPDILLNRIEGGL